MASDLKNYIVTETTLTISNGTKSVRSGVRSILKDEHNNYTLGKHLSGQLPYYYRTVESILLDFEAEHSALEATIDLVSTAPNSPKFRNSHCGEILCAHFVESQLGYRRLYSKLTMTTSEDTNAHKMDGLFVRTTSTPFEYLFLEAKTSILPTTKSPAKTHRSGILKKMIESLNKFHDEDPRFELTRIRENLQKAFSEQDQTLIRKDLTPPGPINMQLLGMSVTNEHTVNSDDDNFILSEPCAAAFGYRAITVTNLAELSKEAYGYWDAVKDALTLGKTT